MPSPLHTGVGALEGLTPDYLKRTYLRGLVFVDDERVEYEPEWYANHINYALSRFEQRTFVAVAQREIEDEPHDYYMDDYMAFGFIQLFYHPVTKVFDDDGNPTSPSVQMVYPAVGDPVMTWPTEWIRLDERRGQIQLLPTAGTMSQMMIGVGGSFLPLIFRRSPFIPQLWRVSYRIGFGSGQVPLVILGAICKLACIEILSVTSDTVNPPGKTSTSISADGLSQSSSFQAGQDTAPAFASRIRQYKNELFGTPGTQEAGLLQEIKEYYHGGPPFIGA